MPLNTNMGRRNFITRAACAGLAASAWGACGLAHAQQSRRANAFKMNFAPHPGMFRASAGNDVLDQIRFAHDHGFTAWEHNSMPREEPALQEQIGKLLATLDMKMGVFVAFADFEQPIFAVNRDDYRASVLDAMNKAVAVARRCNAKYMTVVPGTVDQQSIHSENWNRYGGGRLDDGYQTANTVDLLRRCADLLEPHGLVMVLEPLNWKTNHGGAFLQRSDQAYAICKAVDNPSCKILFDIYHQQITEGNLIPNIDQCWDQIAYFQSGDNPGRKEPGTGEINYGNVFQHIHDRAKASGRDFIVGMEHGNSQKGAAGEQAVIQAYRSVEPT